MSESGKDIGSVLNGRLRIEWGNNRLIVNDGTTDILLVGDGTNGITVDLAQKGFDVKTTTPDHLIFSSRFNLPKIVDTDSFTLLAADFAGSGNSYLTQLATKIIDLDDFSVTNPIVWVFIENALGDIIPLPFYSFNLDTGALNYQAIASVNTSSNDLYVEVRSIAALSPGVTFRYYILQETAAA